MSDSSKVNNEYLIPVLQEAGIIDDPAMVRKVTIEIRADRVPAIIVERFCDQRTADVLRAVAPGVEQATEIVRIIASRELLESMIGGWSPPVQVTAIPGAFWEMTFRSDHRLDDLRALVDRWEDQSELMVERAEVLEILNNEDDGTRWRIGRLQALRAWLDTYPPLLVDSPEDPELTVIAKVRAILDGEV